MKVIKSVEFDNEDEYGIAYTLDDDLSVESFSSIVEQFADNHDALLDNCMCLSFGDKGTFIDYFYSADKILKAKDFPDPFVSFNASFIDKNTRKYKFTLFATTNSKRLTYSVIKKNLQDYMTSTLHGLGR